MQECRPEACSNQPLLVSDIWFALPPSQYLLLSDSRLATEFAGPAFAVRSGWRKAAVEMCNLSGSGKALGLALFLLRPHPAGTLGTLLALQSLRWKGMSQPCAFRHRAPFSPARCQRTETFWPEEPLLRTPCHRELTLLAVCSVALRVTGIHVDPGQLAGGLTFCHNTRRGRNWQGLSERKALLAGRK